MSTKRAQPIIITGMHRSGTSFMASLMAASSIDIGPQLLPADSNNTLGYFEDVEFLDLQRRILSESCAQGEGGHPDWGWTESESLDFTTLDRFLPEARALVASRSGEASHWGWKDPRTTLLLDFWDELLEDSRYVLVYRFPWDVADSMQRLGAEVFLRNPEYAYHIWTFYNRRIRDFYTRHSDRCLLVSINALHGHFGKFTDLVEGKLGLATRQLMLSDFYREDLFKTIEGADPLIDLVAAAWPECTRLLSELDELADVSGTESWRVRPVKSRFSRPDTNAADAHPVSLSVVIPCYEQGTLLIEAIASVERDAPPNCELIIVNDGSRQARTLEILELLKQCGYFVVDQPNAGLSAARNAAISKAHGRYILPLDDDNRIAPGGFIEEAIRLLDSFPEAGVVYGDRYDFGLRRGVQKISDFQLESMLNGNYIDACAVLRKQVWEDCQGYDPAMSPLEDWELWIHAAAKGWGFLHIPRVTFEYRVRPNSLISRIDSNEVEEAFRKKIRVKHSELYRSIARKEIEALKQQLAEQVEHQNRVEEERRLEKSELELANARIVETGRELHSIKLEVALKGQELEIARSEIEREKGLVAQSRSELALKEQELGNARSEIEHTKGEVAQSQSQLARSQIQLSQTQHELAESQTRLTQSESQVAQSRIELQVISSVSNLKGRRVEELTAVVEDRDAQIAKITNSLGWRLLSLYGRIKYPYLLPLYRLFGARPEAGNSRSSARRT